MVAYAVGWFILTRCTASIPLAQLRSFTTIKFTDWIFGPAEE